MSSHDCQSSDDNSRFSGTDFNPFKRMNYENTVPKQISTTSLQTQRNEEQVVTNGMTTNGAADESFFKCETDDENESSSSTSNNEDVAPSISGSGNDEGNEPIVKDEPNIDCNPSPNVNQPDSKESTNDAAGQPKIKEEPTIYELQQRKTKDHRKYGDRVLLARQARNGMMKLGGGNVSPELWPKNPKNRLARMGGRYAIGYNDLWNFGAPKYAGDPSGYVSWLPTDECDNNRKPIRGPFSAFVKRTVKGSTLGWEYCGEYELTDDLPGVIAAHCVTHASKTAILNDILKSLSKPNGEWNESIGWWKTQLKELCTSDKRPAGPTRLKRLAISLGFKEWSDVDPDPMDTGKERQDREEKEIREKASSAAKARALGLDDEELSNICIAKRLVYFDDFYESFSIKFIRYDEDMYNFCKEGETTKNRFNKKRHPEEPCAKADDWYAIFDQMMTENDRSIKRKRKRSRCSG